MVTARVRPVERRDLAELCGMVHALAAHHGDRALADAATLERDLLGDRPWLAGLVAEVEGGLRGYAILCPRAQVHLGMRGADLHHLFVAEAARGQGLGRQLTAAAADLARELDCRFLVVSAEPDNRAAHAFYCRAGFEPVETGARLFRMRLT